MQLRIEGSDLPGRTWDLGGDVPGHANVHVAVQRRNRPGELLDPRPGDARTVAWTLECAVGRTPAGADITGPYVQGGPGGRFVYLSWGGVDDAGAFTMFRRAKLMLDGIAADVVEAAAGSGRLLARLRLSDARGHPLCAAVRPPLIEWSALPPR